MRRLILFLLLSALPVAAQTSGIVRPQIPLTGNVGPGGTFPLFNNGVITMSDADYNFQNFDSSASIIILNGTLSTTRSVIATNATARGFIYIVDNATNQSIIFRGSAVASGVTIAANTTQMVMSDGTSYVPVGAAGTSSGPTSFSVITTGTNNTATMTIQNPASLTFSGTGTINANRINGVQLPVSQAVVGTSSTGYIVAPTAAYINWAAASGATAILNKPTIPTSADWPGAGTCAVDQFVSALTNGAPPTCANPPTGYISSLIAATKPNTIFNGIYQQAWSWHFGTASVNLSGLKLEEQDVGAGSGNSVVTISSFAGSPTTALTVNGPLNLPLVRSAPALGTDVNGNIISTTPGVGPGGGPTFPVRVLNTTSTTPATATDFQNCTTFVVTAGTPTLQLPALTPPNGQCVTLVNYTTAAAAISRAGTQTINGVASNLSGLSGNGQTAPSTWRIISDGTNYIMSKGFSGSITNLSSGTIGVAGQITVGNLSQVTAPSTNTGNNGTVNGTRWNNTTSTLDVVGNSMATVPPPAANVIASGTITADVGMVAPQFTVNPTPPPPASPFAAQNAPATRNVGHTSAVRVLSPNKNNYLDIDVPDSGNPSITSSTGTVTVSGLGGGPGGAGVGTYYNSSEHGPWGLTGISVSTVANAVAAAHFYYGKPYAVSFSTIYVNVSTGDITNNSGMAIWDVTANPPNGAMLCHSVPRAVGSGVQTFNCAEGTVQLLPMHDYIFLRASAGTTLSVAGNGAGQVPSQYNSANTSNCQFGSNGITCNANFSLVPYANTGNSINFFLR